jgi:microcystin-dependent protein
MPKIITQPIGSIIDHPISTIPAGYLLCDGSAISRTTYANLFASIGTSHGNGNGTTTFNIPDRRGRFVRMRDGGVGRDTDAGSRTAMNAGGNAGDNVGSVQDDALQGHYHSNNAQLLVGGAGGANGGGFVAVAATVSSPITDGVHGTPRTASETRSLNCTTNYFIKY